MGGRRLDRDRLKEYALREANVAFVPRKKRGGVEVSSAMVLLGGILLVLLVLARV